MLQTLSSHSVGKIHQNWSRTRLGPGGTQSLTCSWWGGVRWAAPYRPLHSTWRNTAVGSLFLLLSDFLFCITPNKLQNDVSLCCWILPEEMSKVSSAGLEQLDCKGPGLQHWNNLFTHQQQPVDSDGFHTSTVQESWELMSCGHTSQRPTSVKMWIQLSVSKAGHRTCDTPQED